MALNMVVASCGTQCANSANSGNIADRVNNVRVKLPQGRVRTVFSVNRLCWHSADRQPLGSQWYTHTGTYMH